MFPNSLEQQRVVDVVEQTLDVELKNPVISPTPLPHYTHSIQSRLSGSVTVGVRKENILHFRLDQLFDHHLRDAIAHSGHSQNPLASTLLGDRDSAYRWRKVAPRTHSIPDPVKISLPFCLELLQGLTVHSRRTLIGFDRLICLVHLTLVYLERLVFHSARRHPVSSCFEPMIV